MSFDRISPHARQIVFGFAGREIILWRRVNQPYGVGDLRMRRIASVLVVTACMALIAGCAMLHPSNTQSVYQQKKDEKGYKD